MPVVRPVTHHASRITHPFSWNGLSLDLPADWSPLKLEGDWSEGYALFADLTRPRLGVRWKRVKVKKGTDTLVKRALRDEVGQLAASEALDHSPLAASHWNSPHLYLEPDPPGRDVWASFSDTSKRLVQVVHHADRRGPVLADRILPTLADAPPDGPQRWAVFELSCVAPPGFTLSGQTLNAGDLSLTFERGRSRSWLGFAGLLDPPRRMTIRQIAVASLALTRRPLAAWLAAQQASQKKYYTVGALKRRPPKPVTIVANDGRPLVGLVRTVRRRLRYRWSPRVAGRLVTFALHDERRDRLILAQGHDKAALRKLLKTVGWASAAESNGVPK